MKLLKYKWLVSNARMVGSDSERLGKRRLKSLKSWLTTDHYPLTCTLALGLSSVTFVQVGHQVVRFGALYLLLLTVLSAVVCVPLAVLELGLGQMFSQQGATAVWRAVPVLRGVAFVKLTCSLIYGVCSGVRMAIFAAYAVRSAMANFPMSECRQLIMTEHGYFQNNTYGLECAMRTFLKPYDEDSFWFSIMCVIIFIVWIVVPLCLYSLETGLKLSLTIIAATTLALCLTLAIAIGQNGFTEVFANSDWSKLGSSYIWFSVIWQILLSNRLGMAYLDTIGGTVYSTTNAVRWSLALVVCNVITSWLGVLFWYSVTSGIERDSSVLAALLWTYDSAVHNERNQVWACLAFTLLLCSTALSMITFLYPVFESLSKTFKYRWRVPGVLLLTASMACSMVMFFGGIDVLKYMEETVVPVVVCAMIFIQVVAFFFIYGWRRLRSDLEFMLGSRLRIFWIILWPISSSFVCGLASWQLYTIYEDAMPWTTHSLLELILVASLAVVAIATILVWAVIVIIQQDEYDIFLKIKSSFKPSRKWGPVEPILRHLWIQWSANPHTAELITQVRTHRKGATPAVFHENSATHSVSSSRKSSMEYERKFEEYCESKKSSNSESKVSLEEFAGYRGSTIEDLQGRASNVSSGRISMSSGLGETHVSDYSGSNGNTASKQTEDVHYGQIKQMYY